MISAWIIGIALCLLCLWLLKNSDTEPSSYYDKPRPALRMWLVLVFALGATTPIGSLITGIIGIVVVGMAYLSDVIQWRRTKPFSESKLGKFLNKEIV